MPTRRNGTGRNGGEEARHDVPRWVRTLFDQHERRMAALERAHEEHEERMAEHETRMAKYDRHLEDLERSQKTHEQRERQRTRAIVEEFSHMDRERRAEAARSRAMEERNLAEHREIMAALKDLRNSLK